MYILAEIIFYNRFRFISIIRNQIYAHSLLKSYIIICIIRILRNPFLQDSKDSPTVEKSSRICYTTNGFASFMDNSMLHIIRNTHTGETFCTLYAVGNFSFVPYTCRVTKKVNGVYLGQVLKTELIRLVMEEALCVCPRSVTGTWKNHLLVVRASAPEYGSGVPKYKLRQPRLQLLHGFFYALS